MKKTLLLTFLLPLIAFSQPGKQINNQKMKKVAFEKRIIDKWQEYSKAFEYADYNKIVSYFTYPVTFSILDNPRIINNEEELMDIYKYMRSNVQEGYKYSILDKYMNSFIVIHFNLVIIMWLRFFRENINFVWIFREGMINIFDFL